MNCPHEGPLTAPTSEDLILLRSQAIEAGIRVAIQGWADYGSWAKLAIETAVADYFEARPLDLNRWRWYLTWDPDALAQPAFDVVIEEKSAIDRLGDLAR